LHITSKGEFTDYMFKPTVQSIYYDDMTGSFGVKQAMGSSMLRDWIGRPGGEADKIKDIPLVAIGPSTIQDPTEDEDWGFTVGADKVGVEMVIPEFTLGDDFSREAYEQLEMDLAIVSGRNMRVHEIKAFNEKITALPLTLRGVNGVPTWKGVTTEILYDVMPEGNLLLEQDGIMILPATDAARTRAGGEHSGMLAVPSLENMALKTRQPITQTSCIWSYS